MYYRTKLFQLSRDFYSTLLLSNGFPDLTVSDISYATGVPLRTLKGSSKTARMFADKITGDMAIPYIRINRLLSDRLGIKPALYLSWLTGRIGVDKRPLKRQAEETTLPLGYIYYLRRKTTSLGLSGIENVFTYMKREFISQVCGECTTSCHQIPDPFITDKATPESIQNLDRIYTEYIQKKYEGGSCVMKVIGSAKFLKGVADVVKSHSKEVNMRKTGAFTKKDIGLFFLHTCSTYGYKVAPPLVSDLAKAFAVQRAMLSGSNGKLSIKHLIEEMVKRWDELNIKGKKPYPSLGVIGGVYEELYFRLNQSSVDNKNTNTPSPAVADVLLLQDRPHDGRATPVGNSREDRTDDRAVERPRRHTNDKPDARPGRKSVMQEALDSLSGRSSGPSGRHNRHDGGGS
jgi:hypothetical protein